MYSSTYLYLVYALWSQSFYVARAVFENLRYSWQTAPYTSTTIATLSTKDMFYFSSFTSSWPISPLASSQNFQLDPPFSTGKILSPDLETNEAGLRLADDQLSSPSFRSFGAASVMLCCFPPASSSTPLRPSVYYFLEEALLVFNLVKVS